MTQNQKKALTIGLMETRNGAGSGKSAIHRPDGDTKWRRIRKKRYPLALWRHAIAQYQKKAPPMTSRVAPKEDYHSPSI